MSVHLEAHMYPWGSREIPPSLYLGASSLHSLWESSHKSKQSKLFPEKNCRRCRDLGSFNLPSKNWVPNDWNHLKLPHPPEGSSLGGKANYLFMSFRLSTTLRSMLILAVGTWKKKKKHELWLTSNFEPSVLNWLKAGKWPGGWRERGGEDPRRWWPRSTQLRSKEASTGETLRTYAPVLVSLPGAS